jgi:antitoxin YefM
MTTDFSLNTDELGPSFIDRLKSLFPHKNIAITVTELDETAYLLTPNADRDRLLASLEQARTGQTIIVDPKDFQ